MNSIVKTADRETAGASLSGDLEFERLAPALGALVHNLDLAAPLPDATIEAIREGLEFTRFCSSGTRR